jgi:hypothetical protein
MSIRVRKATIQDIDSALPLVKDFAASFEIIEQNYRGSFASILANPGALALVAKENDRLIGMF